MNQDQTTFVQSIETVNTGGNVMNDVITLNNGTVIAISEEIICLYGSREAYEDNYIPHSFMDMISPTIDENRNFMLTFDPLYYKDITPRQLTGSEINDNNGFSDSDILKINSLEIGYSLKVDGTRVTRLSDTI